MRAERASLSALRSDASPLTLPSPLAGRGFEGGGLAAIAVEQAFVVGAVADVVVVEEVIDGGGADGGAGGERATAR